MKIEFILNGKERKFEIEPQETLAQVLREKCQLTGLKISCDVQVCGACTILVDGLPVSSCTYLAYEARNRHVETIEGLATSEDQLHPLQQAFIDKFAFQCAFCTPGMIMAAKSLLDENETISEEELIHHMDGNICRCTGYLPIIQAIKHAAKTMGKAIHKKL